MENHKSIYLDLNIEVVAKIFVGILIMFHFLRFSTDLLCKSVAQHTWTKLFETCKTCWFGFGTHPKLLTAGSLWKMSWYSFREGITAQLMTMKCRDSRCLLNFQGLIPWKRPCLLKMPWFGRLLSFWNRLLFWISPPFGIISFFFSIIELASIQVGCFFFCRFFCSHIQSEKDLDVFFFWI